MNIITKIGQKVMAVLSRKTSQWLKCLLAVLLAMVGGSAANAYDFKVDGLCYNILSEQDKTVEVTYYYGGNGYNSYDSETLDSEGLTGYKGGSSIPEKVTYGGTEYTVVAVGDYAFADCPDLKSLTIPVSVTSIGEYAFARCASLASVEMPSVTLIEYGAFSDCSRLSSVDIPSSVAMIGGYAFDGCSSLEAVYCHWDEPLVCYPEFTDEVLDSAILYIPTGTKSLYALTKPWNGFKNIVEKNYSSIDATQSVTPTVTVIDGAIVIEGETDMAQPVEVYSTGGECVHRGTGMRIEGLPHGVYVVRVGQGTAKVVL